MNDVSLVTLLEHKHCDTTTVHLITQRGHGRQRTVPVLGKTKRDGAKFQHTSSDVCKISNLRTVYFCNVSFHIFKLQFFVTETAGNGGDYCIREGPERKWKRESELTASVPNSALFCG